MPRAIQRIVSLLLIALMLTFTVGIPVVKYLCPLMSDANPHCPMCLHAPDGVESILPPVASCCASHIIAERNTTPFLGAKSLKCTDVVQDLVAHVYATAPADAGLAFTSFSRHTSPLPLEDALFLRHGCLLI